MVHDSGKVAAVVPAAGGGQRVGKTLPKQFLHVRQKPILIYTLEKLDACPSIERIILVVPADFITESRQMLERWPVRKKVELVSGGKERQDSVRKGLSLLSECDRWVVVHDGVRPFVSVEKTEEVIRAAKQAGAAILALPARDTVKSAIGMTVEETLDRGKLWCAQTPQVFRKDWLIAAYRAIENSSLIFTDDAALVERLGHPVQIIPGEVRNIKITSPEDLGIANAWIGMEDG